MHFVVLCWVRAAVALFSLVIRDFAKSQEPSSGNVFTGSLLSSCQICVVIAAVFGIVIYRVVTVSTFAAFKWALIRNNSQVATTGTAVCINFCIIMLLNVVSELQGDQPRASNTWAAGGRFLLLLKEPGLRESCRQVPGMRYTQVWGWSQRFPSVRFYGQGTHLLWTLIFCFILFF